MAMLVATTVARRAGTVLSQKGNGAPPREYIVEHVSSTVIEIVFRFYESAASRVVL